MYAQIALGTCAFGYKDCNQKGSNQNKNAQTSKVILLQSFFLSRCEVATL